MTVETGHSGSRTSWRRLLRSFATLTVGEGAARFAGLLAIVVMARRLGPGAFGVAVLGTTLVNWFRLIVDSGTELLGTRDTSRRPDQFRALTEPILGLRLALSVAAAGLFAITALLISARPADRQALLLFALVLPTVGLNLRWMVLSLKASTAVAIGNIASQVVLVVGVVFLLKNRHDIAVVPILTALAELAYAAIVMVAAWRHVGLVRPRVDLAAWRRIIAGGFPLAINGLSRTVMYSFDVLLIGVVLTRNDVGIYGAAYKPVLFCSTVAGLLSVSFLSAYSGAARTAERISLARRTVVTLVLASVPAAAVLCAGSGLAVSLLYGPDYSGSVLPLAILAWTIPMIALSIPYANVLIAADHQTELMRHNIAGAVFNAACNLAVVPMVGVSGAAAVTVVSLALVLVLNYRSSVRLGLVEPLRTMRRALAARASRPLASFSGDGR